MGNGGGLKPRVLQGFETGTMESEIFWEAGQYFIARADILLHVRTFQKADHDDRERSSKGAVGVRQAGSIGYSITAAEILTKELIFLILC